MKTVEIIQLVGTIGFLLLFALKFYIATVDTLWVKAGRVAVLWTSIYIFFLFFLRVMVLLHLATDGSARILSSLTVFIPLFATLVELFLEKQMRKHLK